MVADTLITPRLILRQPKADDLPAYCAYCASDRSRFVGGPFDAVKAFEKLSAMIGHWALRGFGRYVIERNGEGIGHAGPLAPADDVPELTWTLWSGASEGQGYATEAAQAAAHHCLIDCGWPRFDITIHRDNEASRNLADRLGATVTDRTAPEWLPEAIIYDLQAEAFA